MKQHITFNKLRLQMVDSQLRSRGISDERVLAAMERVPREEFVSDNERAVAYEDHALPIRLGQTISQPFTVAYMCEAAQLCDQDKVLEIGTGSGYGAAVLSHIANEVYSIERLSELADLARERLQKLGYHNVHIATGDGSLGWPEHAPFDAIIVTAGAASFPHAVAQQLAPGGRLVIPMSEQELGQTMYRFALREGQLQSENLGRFAFVPLISGPARKE